MAVPIPPLTESQIRSFWKRVDKSAGEHACWLWVGVTWKKYGRLYHPVRVLLAHRVAWALAYGEPDGCVLHKCDNPPCCNPSHLFLGSHADNVTDKVSKGRHKARKGEEHGHAKLNEDTVVWLREQVAAGVQQKILAASIGISKAELSGIVTGRVWRHIGGPLKISRGGGRKRSIL